MRRPKTRLSAPLIRDGVSLVETSWSDAIDRVARGLERNGESAFGMLSCSKATNEVNYAAQKFARVVMGSNNVDSCNRT